MAQEHRLYLDRMNRMALPVSIRQEGGFVGPLYLLPSSDQSSVVLMNEQTYEQLKERIRDRFGDEHKGYEKLLSNNSVSVTCDDKGRVPLPDLFVKRILKIKDETTLLLKLQKPGLAKIMQMPMLAPARSHTGKEPEGEL